MSRRDEEDTVETPTPVDAVLRDAAMLAGTTAVSDAHLIAVLNRFGWERARTDAQQWAVRAALEPKDEDDKGDEP